MRTRGSRNAGLLQRAGTLPRLRALVVVAAIIGSVGTMHATAPRAAAIDCVTYYCATITLKVGGAGSVYVYDDQGEMGCSYNGSVLSGTCTVQYYWIGQMSSTMAVTVTYSAAADSYVCLPSRCTDPGGSTSTTMILNRDDSAVAGGTTYLAKAYTFTIDVSGDGSGRVTTTPAGIDCRSKAGVKSGTCTDTFYGRDYVAITVTVTPDAGSSACLLDLNPNECGGVGVATGWSFGTNGGSGTSRVRFALGHPILTVSTQGQGSVLSTPSGISCGSSCSSYFPPGTNVTLQAAAKAGSVFDHWTGACGSFGATCNLSLSSTDVSTTAVFASIATPGPTNTPAPGTTPPPTKTPAPGSTPPPTKTPAPGSTPVSGATQPTQSASSAPSAPASPAVSDAPSGNEPSGPTSPQPGGSGASPAPDGSGAAPSAARGGELDPSAAAGTGPDPLLLVVFVLGGLVLLLGGALGGVLLSRRRAPAGPP